MVDLPELVCLAIDMTLSPHHCGLAVGLRKKQPAFELAAFCLCHDRYLP
jgi:hypothetical protein